MTSTTRSHRLIDLHVPPSRPDRAELEKHLPGGDPALLLTALVQITGDASLLDRFGPGLTMEQRADARLLPMGRLPEEDRAELHGLLVEALAEDDPTDFASAR
ncbi:hypothetical protein ABT009_24885 [Streptomyces sp. NPDC002896]|uniref:hypothetical protein n=1 Tax=Streptomyces sp. NPDC002896 TaxID=3154438 RepID=UPI0033252AE5